MREDAQGYITGLKFYIKLACATLKIERDKLHSVHFLKICQNSSKDFEIINGFAELMDNLGYDRTDVLKIKNKGFKSHEECYLFGVHLRVLGAHKFYSDLKLAIEKYGKLAGIWRKQKARKLMAD